MKVLLIQENGRHNENRHFRECFCLQRGFEKLGHNVTVWGLGHDNYNSIINFEDFDLIINLENYDSSMWVPNLSNVNTIKFLWSIDPHVRGENPYLKEFKLGNYNILLHSIKDYVNEDYKVWFPNSFDDTLISPRDIGKRCDVGFCGSLLNRNEYINLLSSNFNFIYDNFVIGDSMVNAINSYKIHWNRNISNDINYRSFETIGCGIPLVTNYNYQYEELGFIDGVNVMMYKDNNEMIFKINKLLSDDKLRESIGKSGLELSKQHTYEKRCEFLINLYNK
jgi:hypothetical protein